MAISLFVGNFPFKTEESELWPVFSNVGEVESVTLISDRQTGRPRGFGFVKMEETAGRTAIEVLNGTMFGGRPLVVKEAKPLEKSFSPRDRGQGYRPRDNSGSGRNSYRDSGSYDEDSFNR
jgi:RNA recognition motif-containing protein